MSKFFIKVLRGISGNQYWEQFALEFIEGMNVISALMQIRKSPVNTDGIKVQPIAWESICLEEVCGSCSMLVNGLPRQGCTALINKLLQKSNTITLAPFSKFPLIRDLVVDRGVMFGHLKKVMAWNPIEGYHSKDFGPKISPELASSMYDSSTCMTCGCCLEACPQVNSKSAFIGAAAINQAKLFNQNPIGKTLKRKRIAELMKKGGIAECGNAQNCVQVCPKKIKLDEAIAQVGRDASKELKYRLFGYEPE